MNGLKTKLLPYLFLLGILFSSCKEDEPLNDQLLSPEGVLLSLSQPSLIDGDQASVSATVKFGVKLNKALKLQLLIEPKDLQNKDFSSALGFLETDTMTTRIDLTLEAGSSQKSVKFRQNPNFTKSISKDIDFWLKISKISDSELDASKIKPAAFSLKQKTTKKPTKPAVKLVPKDFSFSLNRDTLTQGVDGELEANLHLSQAPDTALTITLGLAPKVQADSALVGVLGMVAEGAVKPRLQLMLDKGMKKTTFKIKLNPAFKERLFKDVVCNLRVEKVEGRTVTESEIGMQEITCRKGADIPDFTEAQLAILHKYPYLKKWIGTVKVSTKVYVDADNANKVTSDFPMYPQFKTYTGSSQITLSEAATLSNPALKIVNNAMGMKDFCWMVFKKLTLEDADWGLTNTPSPVLKATRELLKWTVNSKESFDMALDELVLSPKASDPTKGGVKFIDWLGLQGATWDATKHIEGTKVNYPKDIYAVNFNFSFSGWTKFLNQYSTVPALKKNYEFFVKGQGAGQSDQPDPNWHLFYGYSILRKSEVAAVALKSGHSSDYDYANDHAWGNPISLDEGETTSSYDNSKGEMKFKFMYQPTYSGSDMVVEVTYSTN